MSILAPASASTAPRGVGEAVLRIPVAAAQAGDAAIPAPAPSAEPQPSALQVAVSAAASRQDGLAGLMADLGAALATPGLSPDLKAVMSRVLGFQLPTQPPPTAADLRSAMAASGLFLEARLASGPASASDLKAALSELGQALAATARDEPAPALDHAPPAPPYRDGPQTGQPAVAADLAPTLPPQVLAAHLLRRVSGALSRQLLQQAASTPRPGGASWLFELPLATPQGAAVAQFEIDAEDPPPSAADLERAWRARFTLDLAGVGPVHVNLALRGSALRADLWVEAPDAATRLDAERARLATALQAQALEPQIAIRPGAPQVLPTPPGRFVDSAA